MKNTIEHILRRYFSYRVLGAFLVVIGIAFRLKHFLENRSFWSDEAYVALQVLSQNFKDILWNTPFSSDLPNPSMGFLFMEKLFVAAFGNREIAFRAFPFLCSIAALFVFIKILNKAINKKAAVLALGLFVFCEPLIYYAAELKQYSSDVLVSLFLLLAAKRMFQKDHFDFYSRIKYSIFGIAAISFSHSAFFILVGAGSALILLAPSREKRVGLVKIFCFWLLGFLFWYAVSYRHMIHSSDLIKGATQHDAFASGPPSFLWYLDKLYSFVAGPFGFAPAWVSISMFIAGLVSFFKKDKRIFAGFLLPLFFVFMANAIHKFPLLQRQMLFYLPIFIICASEGIVFVSGQAKRLSVFVYSLLAIAVFFSPAFITITNFTKGRAKEEARPLMQILKREMKQGDNVYVTLQSSFAYLYYAGQLDIKPAMKMYITILSDNNFALGGEEYFKTRRQMPLFSKESCFKGYLKENKNDKIFGMTGENVCAQDKRAWFLFFHKSKSKDMVLRHLKKKTKELKEFNSKGASLYLFECG